MGRLWGMLATVAVLCAATAAHAQDARMQPPSKTLERATKLYNDADYMAASIDFTEVINGYTNDSEAHRQRAQFFLAKTLYQLQLFGASMQAFSVIVDQGATHRYFDATLMWLVALEDHLPAFLFRYQLSQYEDRLDDPQYDDLLDRAAYLIGDGMIDVGRYADAIALLETIPSGADTFVKAQLALARAHLAGGDLAAAVGAYGAVPPDDPEAGRAALGIARAHLALGDRQAALEAYERVGAGTDRWASLARLEAYLATHPETLAGVDSATLAAMIHVEACPGGTTTDALAGARAAAAQVTAQLGQVLAHEDDMMMYEALERAVAEPIAENAHLRAVHAVLLDSQPVADVVRALAAMRAELDHVGAMDPTWRTTEVAAAALQELSLLQSLMENDAGRAIRPGLERVVADLDAIAGAPKVSVSELGVEPGTCPGQDATSAEPEVPVVVSKDPQLPAQPRPDNGCVSCSAGSEGAANALLLALAAFAATRRRRRADI